MYVVCVVRVHVCVACALCACVCCVCEHVCARMCVCAHTHVHQSSSRSPSMGMWGKCLALPGYRLSHSAGRRVPICCEGSKNVGTDPISQEAGRRHQEAQEGMSGPVTNTEVLEVRTGRDLKMLRSPEGRTYPRSPPALESGLGLWPADSRLRATQHSSGPTPLLLRIPQGSLLLVPLDLRCCSPDWSHHYPAQLCPLRPHCPLPLGSHHMHASGRATACSRDKQA